MKAPGSPQAWSVAALAGLALVTALAVAAPLGWPFELFAHFRSQYAATAAILALVLFMVNRRGYAIFAAGIALFHALPALQKSVADEPVAACHGPVLTVVAANLQYSNRDTQRFLDWLAAHPADLVVLQEVTGDWQQAVGRVPGYDHRQFLVREDPYGLALLSRWPLEAFAWEDLAGDGLPSMSGVVAVDGQRLRFLGLHTHWPVLPELARQRDRSLDNAAELLRSESTPAVALGDLNLTAYSPVFGTFLDAARLRDAMQGAHWRPTWMAGFWPLALRIDHVLVTPDLCVEHTEVGPAIGSDHRPVMARLRLP
jgi:endonuclease/exonuclease/phosphatase (EEP) superfamily protein YafD